MDENNLDKGIKACIKVSDSRWVSCKVWQLCHLLCLRYRVKYILLVFRAKPAKLQPPRTFFLATVSIHLRMYFSGFPVSFLLSPAEFWRYGIAATTRQVTRKEMLVLPSFLLATILRFSSFVSTIVLCVCSHSQRLANTEMKDIMWASPSQPIGFPAAW
jgi:hypothetical protein